MSAVADLLSLFGIPVPAGVDVEQMIAQTVGQRPTCLPVGQQDLAQMWFVAFMIQTRNEQGAFSGGATGAVIEEREGDLSRKYSEGAKNQVRLSDVYYKRWQDLAKLCGVAGAVTDPDGNVVQPVRRGAISIGDRFPGPGEIYGAAWPGKVRGYQ